MGGLLVAVIVGSLASSPVVGAREADRARIQRHLEAVERSLRATDVSHLSADLQRERARNLDRLRGYRLAGEFPHNDDYAGERVPYFIDASGRLCAVGHLVVASGFREVADDVFEAENNAKLLEMQHAALPAWIEASGLTAEEHAAIQPAYCSCDEEEALVCGVDGRTYANACVAETCAGVEIEHDGPCWSDGTTGWPAPGSSTAEEELEDASAGTSSSDEAGTSVEGTIGDTGSGTAVAREPETEAPAEEDGALRPGCRLGRDPPAPLALLPLLLLMARRRRARCGDLDGP